MKVLMILYGMNVVDTLLLYYCTYSTNTMYFCIVSMYSIYNKSYKDSPSTDVMILYIKYIILRAYFVCMCVV